MQGDDISSCELFDPNISTLSSLFVVGQSRTSPSVITADTAVHSASDVSVYDDTLAPSSHQLTGNGQDALLLGPTSIVRPAAPVGVHGDRAHVQAESISHLATTGITTISATGGTIHHHGLLSAIATSSTTTTTTTTMASSETYATKCDSIISSMNTMETGASEAHKSGAPPQKKMKLELDDETENELRQQIIGVRYKDIISVKDRYTEYLTELFFLRNGGNLMDYMAWKKRSTPQLLAFLQSSALENLADDVDFEDPETLVNDELQYTAVGNTAPVGTPVAISTTLPPNVSAAIQYGAESRKPGGRHGMLFGPHQPTEPLQSPVPPGGVPVVSSPVGLPGSTIADLSLTLDSSLVDISASMLLKKTTSPRVSSQDAIVERAKHEAQVMARIGELRKDGLWSIRRLPKVQEPGRNKAHWDYLLEEMQWLAADFAQERKWKKAGCRKIARIVMRYHQEKEQSQVRAEKEESQKPMKIARHLAKMIDDFWSSIEKVVQYKQQTRLDEKRKKAMDLQLSFIVDQTEKYSTWLTEGLVRDHSIDTSATTSPMNVDEDGEFCPSADCSSDDEETIDKEEEDLNDADTQAEIDALQKDGELSLEELLRSLPAEVLEKPASLDLDHSMETKDEMDDAGQEVAEASSEEFEGDEEKEDDDEVTLGEQEEHEMKEDNVREEMDDLKAEGEMSIEELRAKYAGAYDSDFEMPETPDGSEMEEEEEDEEEDDNDDGDEEADGDDDSVGGGSVADSIDDELAEELELFEDVGMEALLHDAKPEDGSGEPSALPEPESKLPGDETDVALQNIAAQAQSLQPTGYTLTTTKKKKVPTATRR